MQLHVKGKNLEVSDAIRSYAERKLAKLDKQLHDTTRVEIELAVEKNPSVSANQVAEATVWLKGQNALSVHMHLKMMQRARGAP